MTDRNEVANHKKLIEEAAKVLDEGLSDVANLLDKERVRDLARAALSVFEKALGEATVTPTYDEREALRIAELDARQAAYRQDCTDWFVDHEQEPGITTNAFFRGWDAAVDGGFRRTEVPEPKCEHGTSLAELCELVERLVNAEPQGEPSDAQVDAALEAFSHSDGAFVHRDRMRAALRAANEVR